MCVHVDMYMYIIYFVFIYNHKLNSVIQLDLENAEPKEYQYE